MGVFGHVSRPGGIKNLGIEGGVVSRADIVGGLVGYNSDRSTVTASFWNTETSGQAASAAGTGLTTSEMQQESTYTDAGWDFDTVWAMEPGGYPYLLCLDAVPEGEGEGESAVEGEREAEGEWNGTAEFFLVDASHHATPIVGICTDGVAEAYVKISDLPSWVTESDIQVNTNPPLGTLLDKAIDSDAHIAFQRYLAPDTYPGGSSSTSTLTFSVKIGKKTVYPELKLARPPVVMLHGWGGDSEKWTPMKDALKAGFKFTYAHNYHKTSLASFATNRDEAFLAVSYAKKQARQEGFAVSRADLVAHSMGGIVGRYYIQALGTVPYCNDIRRFITIGTPHSGSELANIGILLRGLPPPLDSKFSMSMRANGMDLWLGAADDLAVDSHAIEDRLNAVNLGKNPVRTHAIIGDAQGFQAEGWAKVLWNTASYVAGASADAVLGVPNDFVVGAVSQGGGLSEAYTTYLAVPWHIPENTEQNVIDKVIALLDAPDETNFAAQGFVSPPNIDFLFDWDPFKKELNTEFSKTLTITVSAPGDGAVFAPGEPIEIRAEAAPTASSLFVLTPFDAQAFDGAECSFLVLPPEDFLGDAPITVLGRDENGLAASPLITIHIATSATVNELTVYPDGTLSVLVGRVLELQVMGAFSDGVSRDVTAQTFGTTYSSSLPDMAAVSENGIVTGVKEGRTNITVSNGVSLEVPVEVIAPEEVGEGEGEGDRMIEGEGEGADTTPPMAVCQPFTLDLAGGSTVTPADVDGGSTVTLTVKDAANHEASCTATVTVTDITGSCPDTTPPVAVCKNVTIDLAGGAATLDAAAVDNGSMDERGIVTRTLSKTSFACADLGVQSVTLTVADAAGNTDTCVATVTVTDSAGSCAAPVEGEDVTPQEGEGEAVTPPEGEDEGEPETVIEGEGEANPEGEGEPALEGEASAEGEANPEGEGEPTAEGEGEGEIVTPHEGENTTPQEGEGESDAPKPSKFLGCGAGVSDGAGTSGDVLWMTVIMASIAALRRNRKAGQRSQKGHIPLDPPSKGDIIDIVHRYSFPL